MSEFPFDQLQSLQARHHKFSVSSSRNECIGSLFPEDIDSFEVCLETNFTSSLRAEDSTFLRKITELNILAESDVDLDLRFLPSLQRLCISCECAEALKSLRCGPLEHLSLMDVHYDIRHLDKPVLAKSVDIEYWKSSDTVVQLFPVGGGPLFPDTERLSLSALSYDRILVNLDHTPRLRHVQVHDPECTLISTHPIQLISLTTETDAISENITTWCLKCDGISVALQMSSVLRHVSFSSSLKIDRRESMLMLPRSTTVGWGYVAELNRAAWYHMMLNRHGAADGCSATLQRVQECAFSWLARTYDESLLLRLLRETGDISKFEWRSKRMSISRDEQCQAFRVMAQSGRAINWSRVANPAIHPDALEWSLSQRPGLTVV